jgi:hypothetical protein
MSGATWAIFMMTFNLLRTQRRQRNKLPYKTSFNTALSGGHLESCSGRLGARGAADGLRLLPNSSLRGFFVMAAEFHLAEDALALHLLLRSSDGGADGQERPGRWRGWA